MPKISLRLVLDSLRAIRRALAGDAALYEAAGDNARFHAWSGDQYIDDDELPVIVQLRVIPRPYFREMQSATPERLHVIHVPERQSRHLRLLA